ncbi:MAG: large subunit ribosomal protein L10 [Flavobacteriales bacterium]
MESWPYTSIPGDNLVAIGFEDKKAIVADVNETAANAISLVVADARGVTAGAMDSLRKQARESGVNLRVVRNTLAKRAMKGTEFECVNDALVGPSIFGFSMEDPGAAARLFKDFAKEQNEFEVKVLSVGGKSLAAEQIDALAKLPTLEQALGQLASVIIAPVTKLVRTFNEVPSKVTRVVAAVGDKKKAESA